MSIRFYCDGCEEDVLPETVSGVRRCPVCGSILTQQSTGSQGRENENGAPAEVRNAETIFEQLVGGGVSANTGASEKAIASLKHVTVDLRSDKPALDPRVSVTVSGIQGECIGVPATFGPFRDLDNVPIALCDPITANTSQMMPNINGKVAVAERGGDVSFMFKAKAAEKSGAIGLLVVQTFDVWPFVPGDSAGEAVRLGGINIPVVCLSKEIGFRLISHLRNSDSSSTVTCSFHVMTTDNDNICAICQDDLASRDQTALLQMPCLHYFHESCVMPWLKTKSTCPTCRFALESSNPMANMDAMARMAREVDRGALMGWFG